jgi:hypothetical protein
MSLSLSLILSHSLTHTLLTSDTYNGVPSKVGGPASGNNATLSTSTEGFHLSAELRAPKGEGAQGVRTLVFVGCQKVVQALVSAFVQEPTREVTGEHRGCRERQTKRETERHTETQRQTNKTNRDKQRQTVQHKMENIHATYTRDRLTTYHLMYGPGIPPRELKHRQVSSTITGDLMVFEARRHFSAEISSGSPCSSGTGLQRCGERIESPKRAQQESKRSNEQVSEKEREHESPKRAQQESKRSNEQVSEKEREQQQSPRESKAEGSAESSQERVIELASVRRRGEEKPQRTINFLGDHIKMIAKDGQHLLQFVGVSGDEHQTFLRHSPGCCSCCCGHCSFVSA